MSGSNGKTRVAHPAEHSAIEVHILDPEKIRFQRGSGGTLRMTLEDYGSWMRVEAVQTYPFSAPGQLISIRDALHADTPEIGLIENLADLREEDRAIVAEELNRRYVFPKVKRIVSVRESYGTLEWKVETDRGERTFTMRDVHHSIRSLGGNDYLLMDIDECRYRIPDLLALDKRSHDLFDKHFYQ